MSRRRIAQSFVRVPRVRGRGLITYSDSVVRDDSLGMSLRQRLSGHRVLLLMNVIAMRASQSGAGIRQCGHSLVTFVANTR